MNNPENGSFADTGDAKEKLETDETAEAQNEPEKKKRTPRDIVGDIYELCEMLGLVTIVVMLVFAFVARLNIVDGHSMDHTLADGQYLAVSDLFYDPKPGDIVIIHKTSAEYYNKPIVKRVIATAGQTVDIDFETWTLTVDGEVVDEPYRYLDDGPTLTAEYRFPITVGENEIFVMGDNRNHSGDSRTRDLYTIDKRCVVGRAMARLYPLDSFTVFKNPFEE